MKLHVIKGGSRFRGKSKLIATPAPESSDNKIQLTLSDNMAKEHIYRIADSIYSDQQKRKALLSFLDNTLRIGLKEVVIATLNEILIENSENTEILPLVSKKP